MLAKAIQRALKPYWSDCTIDMVKHSDCDLLDLFQTRKRFLYFKPDYVIHLANFSGNNQFNQKFPAETFYRCTQISLNVLKCCHDYDVEKCLSVVPSCAYGDSGELLKEENFWQNKPHDSIESHGLARRNAVAFSRQLNKVSTTKFVTVIFNLLYGPHDSFDLSKTKVVGSLVKKFCDASRNNEQVFCWGDGSDRREFLYVDDAAEGLLRSFASYDNSDLPLNLGWGTDYSIKNLAQSIANLASFKGEIVWEESKGGAQKSKLLDVSRQKDILGWYPKVGLLEGLNTTIKFYKDNYL